MKLIPNQPIWSSPSLFACVGAFALALSGCSNKDDGNPMAAPTATTDTSSTTSAPTPPPSPPSATNPPGTPSNSTTTPPAEPPALPPPPPATSNSESNTTSDALSTDNTESSTAVVTSEGDSTEATSSGGEETTPSGGEFSFTSPDHTEGAVFASEVTCEACGFDANKMVMPGLEWTAGPEGTMSYALVFIDTTLYEQNDPLGNHWAIWNIPASTLSLPKGMKAADIPSGATQTGNFLGPCPSFGGTATHEYAFILYAMPTATVNVNNQGQATGVVGNAITMFEAEALARLEVTGTSSAAPGQGGACN